MLENHPIGARGTQNHSGLSELTKRYWLSVPILILVTLIYVWFVSAGTWTTWISATHLYDDLARGFRAGHLYLPVRVNQKVPPVSGLQDNSTGFKAQGPLDVSYFDGKYYLYWGPVPALVLLLVHTFVARSVGDLQLTLGFLIGIFMLECLLAVVIWQRFFANLPRHILWASILLMGLASPATFLLDSTRGARIYEAAITGGQFFLLGGFIAVLTCLSPNVSRWRLAVAGILWAFAIGTRLTLALPIGFMVLNAAWWIVSANHWSLKSLTQLVPLILPFGVAAACLAWYNWARFGSPLETGFSYQMTTNPAFQEHSGELIQPIFILQNFFNYFLNPFTLESEFPYFHAQYGNVAAIFPFYRLPAFYASQIVTGIVYTVPFLVFAAISLMLATDGFLRKRAGQPLIRNETRQLLDRMVLSLGSSVAASLAFLLSFFWVAERYVEDVMPALLMLATIGFWRGLQSVSNAPTARKLYTGVGISLIAVSILMSTLAALSVNYLRFDLIRILSSAR